MHLGLNMNAGLIRVGALSFVWEYWVQICDFCFVLDGLGFNMR
jgi:hypothetical protein